MHFFTIGYGGRPPAEFADLLVRHAVPIVVDVRLRPDRASMGAYVQAKSPDKGIERLLADHGIAYTSLVELGNVFLGSEDWPERYRQLMAAAGELLTARLEEMPERFCLLCAEKRVDQCHRRLIADFLVGARGWTVEHLE